jgi:transcriptional regulator with XRE-family HTH domain
VDDYTRTPPRQWIGNRARTQREAMGWSQRELADRLRWPVRRVIRLEHGQVPAELETIDALALALQTSVSIFIAPLFPGMPEDEVAAVSERAVLRYVDQFMKEQLRQFDRLIHREAAMRVIPAMSWLPDDEVAFLQSWVESRAQAFGYQPPSPAADSTSDTTTASSTTTTATQDRKPSDHPATQTISKTIEERES